MRQATFMEHKPGSYIPNEIPLKSRITSGIFASILIAISGYAIYRQHIVIPYAVKRRRNALFEFTGAETIIPILAMTFATIALLAIVLDHYDKRFNERTYQLITNIGMGIGLFLYMISMFFGHRVA